MMLFALSIILWLTSSLVYAAPSPPNLILISMDTTRFDALSCYGGLQVLGPELVSTPNIDGIAKDGVRFESFWAHAPSTLNSHASMFTGLDPHGHGVVRNGYPLSESIPTLPQRLRSAGYQTIGVVGSSVLEQTMGLSRGFQVYDDTFEELSGLVYQDRAAGVVDRTIGALSSSRRGDAPLFLFLHFFDAHAPYDAPDPFYEQFVSKGGDVPVESLREDFSVRDLAVALRDDEATDAEIAYAAARYLGEVAYVDSEIGRLLSALDEMGLLHNTLLVITADHGEVLHEEPLFAYSHGSDVSEGAMHVPLIMKSFGYPLRSGIVKRHASMDQLAPTLEQALGLPMTLGSRQGVWSWLGPGPLLDVDGWPDHPTRPILMEATRPRVLESKTHWNNLGLARSVHVGEWALERFEAFELPYVLVPRPQEGVASLLQGIMNEWDEDVPEYREQHLGPMTRKALEVLGYLEPEEPPPSK